MITDGFMCSICHFYIETYKKLRFLASGKFVDAELTVSKTIEALATRAAKKLGYKNGKSNT